MQTQIVIDLGDAAAWAQFGGGVLAMVVALGTPFWVRKREVDHNRATAVLTAWGAVDLLEDLPKRARAGDDEAFLIPTSLAGRDLANTASVLAGFRALPLDSPQASLSLSIIETQARSAAAVVESRIDGKFTDKDAAILDELFAVAKNRFEALPALLNVDITVRGDTDLVVHK